MNMEEGEEFIGSDQNNDGQLDLFTCNLAREDSLGPTTLLLRENGTFVDKVEQIELIETSLDFAQLNTAGNSKDLKLVAISSNKFYHYDYNTLPFQHTETLTANSLKGAIVQDLNGDLLPDIYATTGIEATEARITQDTVLVFMSRTKDGDAAYAEVKFETDSIINFLVDWSPNVPEGIRTRIFLGRDKYNPPTTNFLLDPNNELIQGEGSIDLLDPKGVYIGYLPNTGKWIIKVVNFQSSSIPVIVRSFHPILNLTRVDFSENDKLATDYIFFQNGDGSYNKVSNFTGASNFLTSSSSVIAEDLDNDMDVDVFISTTNTTINSPNILLENDGNGEFSVIGAESGAQGTLTGRGGTVIAADYDNNGTMDLLTENGQGLFFNYGPLELFRNDKTENNWIQLNLEGTISNRNAVGALVYCYSGGIAQVRLNQLGLHKNGQNYKRIHFGLAQNEMVDSLVIYWPSGIVQSVQNLFANQILTIVEEETTVTSIFEDNYGNSIRISPVPFNDHFAITPLKGFSDTNVKIRILDISGKVVHDVILDRFDHEISIDNFIGAKGDLFRKNQRR